MHACLKYSLILLFQLIMIIYKSLYGWSIKRKTRWSSHILQKLPLKLIDAMYLQKCINFKLRIGVKFEAFCLFLDYFAIWLKKKKQYMMITLGDFDPKSNSWYANGNTNIEGSKIDTLTSSFGFNQIIN